MAVIDEEDLVPRNQPRKPKDLTLLGIADLEEYIAALDTEIARARASSAGSLSISSGLTASAGSASQASISSASSALIRPAPAGRPAAARRRAGGGR